MSRKRNYYPYSKPIEELRAPKRDTSAEIDQFALERFVEAQINGIMDIDQILNSRPFTKDELRLVKLILAKHAYLANNFAVGDELVREIESSKDKGTTVFFYLEQLKKNKKLYSQKARQEPTGVKIKQKTKEIIK